MNIREHNRRAWDRQVKDENEWTVPVSRDSVDAARRGDWQVLVTPLKPVPSEWMGDVSGKEILCLASGGGQQAPILAAAGARVTVFDNSPRQLAQDRLVADRDRLNLTTVEGDMRDLTAFADATFDLILHPVSNVFVPDVIPVWREAYRVLRSKGVLIAGFDSPVVHLFDHDEVERTGKLEVVHSIPYSDAESLSSDTIRRYEAEGIPLEFGHSLDAQVGGQLRAGFVITGLFEDYDTETGYGPLGEYIPPYIATRAVKTQVGW